MLLREKALYHQIHPAKVAVDVLTEPVSLFFFWRHDLALGLITHFAPPIMASVALMTFGGLERQKSSNLGRYVARHMSRGVEAVRFGGDVVMVFGAWYRAPLVIAGGLLIVALAWLGGLVRPRVAV
jgi:hypothetical protein